MAIPLLGSSADGCLIMVFVFVIVEDFHLKVSARPDGHTQKRAGDGLPHPPFGRSSRLKKESRLLSDD